MKKIILSVIALVALAFTLTPLGAQAASWIDGQRLKPQSVTSNKIAEGGVGASEVRNGSLTGSDMNSSTVKRFLAGETAVKQNAGQDSKISSLEDRVEAEEAEGDTVGFNTARAGAGYTQTVPANSIGVVYGKCPEARPLAISGGYRLNGWAAESFSGSNQPRVDDVLVLATEPAAFQNGALVNSYQNPAFPQTEGGSFQANAWATTIQNDSDNELQVRAWATCVAID